jgi:Tol biopolymer transport system component
LNLIPQAWSPDGARIAFEGWDDSKPSRTGVYTAAAADGADLVRLTVRPGPHHDIPLDYSPDGKRLVLYRSVGADPDPYIGGSLWVVDVDGSDLHQVAPASTRPAPWARWSRNGDRIMFANERTAPAGAIWTVHPDGTHLTRIFADRHERFPIQPVWSPNGHQILFALDPTNDQFTHPANSLDMINSDGSHLQEVRRGNNFKSQPEWWP